MGIKNSKSTLSPKVTATRIATAVTINPTTESSASDSDTSQNEALFQPQVVGKKGPVNRRRSRKSTIHKRGPRKARKAHKEETERIQPSSNEKHTFFANTKVSPFITKQDITQIRKRDGEFKDSYFPPVISTQWFGPGTCDFVQTLLKMNSVYGNSAEYLNSKMKYERTKVSYSSINNRLTTRLYDPLL